MLRWIAALFIGLGLALLAVDLWPVAVQGATFRLTALGDWWAWAHRDSLLLLQPAIERHLSPALWDPGVQTLLEWPAAIQALVLGGALRLVAGRRSGGRPGGGLTFGRR